jgi:hypothetical protein
MDPPLLAAVHAVVGMNGLKTEVCTLVVVIAHRLRLLSCKEELWQVNHLTADG